MIDVVGVTAAGAASLAGPQRALVESADVIVSSSRLLATLDGADGNRLDGDDAERVAWPSPLRAGLPALLERLDGRRVVVLATGDPFVSGIATTLREIVGDHGMRVHPAASSVALARARMGWDASEHSWVSLVGRPLGRVTAHCAPGARVLCLSSDESTPHALAQLLVARGLGATTMSVLGDIGSPGESRHDCTATQLADEASRALPRLNVVALHLPRRAEGDDGPVSGRHALLGRAPGRPDEAFFTEGQLTKRDVRAAALAALRPEPGGLLWDLGAGTGSISVEWCLAHDTCRAVAVERHADRVALIRRNAEAIAPGIDVVEGDVRDLPGGPRPSAIFLGGGADAALVRRAWNALDDGGRLVAHAVTLDTEAALVEAFSWLSSDADADDVELRRISVETAAALGGFTAWKPARAVVQLSAVKNRYAEHRYVEHGDVEHGDVEHGDVEQSGPSNGRDSEGEDTP